MLPRVGVFKFTNSTGPGRLAQIDPRQSHRQLKASRSRAPRFQIDNGMGLKRRSTSRFLSPAARLAAFPQCVRVSRDFLQPLARIYSGSHCVTRTASGGAKAQLLPSSHAIAAPNARWAARTVAASAIRSLRRTSRHRHVLGPRPRNRSYSRHLTSRSRAVPRR
jgi:hypothetical protein